MALTLQRSTSLKTRNSSGDGHSSPPPSPQRKKIVRFADSLGLDLEAVKMIMQEDLPAIPESAYAHLKNIDEDWLPASVGLRSASPNRSNGVTKTTMCNGSTILTPPGSPKMTRIKMATNGSYFKRPMESGLRLNINSPYHGIRNSLSSLAMDTCGIPNHGSCRCDSELENDLLITSDGRSGRLPVGNGNPTVNHSNPLFFTCSKSQESDKEPCDHHKSSTPSSGTAVSCFKSSSSTTSSNNLLSSALLNSSIKPGQDGSSGSVVAMPPWLSLYQQQHKSTLIPEFVEPFVQMNFLTKVKACNVCLENCYVSSSRNSDVDSPTGSGYSSPRLILSPSASSTCLSSAFSSNSSPSSSSCSPQVAISVTCVVRVVNLCFDKQVYIRFTKNNWATFEDVLATYIPSSWDVWSDRFTAAFSVQNLTAGQRVYFAVRYVAGGQEFWDNNGGQNYSLVHRI